MLVLGARHTQASAEAVFWLAAYSFVPLSLVVGLQCFSELRGYSVLQKLLKDAGFELEGPPGLTPLGNQISGDPLSNS